MPLSVAAVELFPHPFRSHDTIPKLEARDSPRAIDVSRFSFRIEASHNLLGVSAGFLSKRARVGGPWLGPY